MNVTQIYDEEAGPVEMKIEPEKEAANQGGLGNDLRTASGLLARRPLRLRETILQHIAALLV
jgi:hypothetical protein